MTVLMAVFDTGPVLLDRAIRSIREQSYARFEFLMIDDGSTARATLDCLAAHAAADARIRLAPEPHRGLTASLNRGLELARGGLIARQDADDWSAPERLELQVRFLDRHPAIAAVGSQAWTHQQDGGRLWRTRLPVEPGRIAQAFRSGNPLVHGSVMFRTAAARAAGGYRTQFRCAQDYDFFWRLAERYELANLSQPLYHYRYSGGSVSSRRAAEQVRAQHAIRALAEARRRGEREDPEAALAAAGARMHQGPGLYRALLKQADHLTLAGDYRAAWKAYGELLRQHPASPLGWGKLARLGVFRAAPFLRELCFR